MAWIDDFRKIAAEYGSIKVMDPDDHLRRSGLVREQCEEVVYSTGHVENRSAPEIMFGFFTDDERRALAFFCALAGTSQPRKPYQKNTTCDAEYFIEPWRQGLVLAEKHGYAFKPSTVAWMLEQIWLQIDGMDREMHTATRGRK